MKQDYKVPDWLNDSYLLRVLKSTCHSTDEIHLIKAHVDSATNKGDNYASEMFRIVLEFTKNGVTGEKRIILKKDHDGQEVKTMFDPYNLYSTEIDYYRHYMPQFEKILSAAGEKIQLSPRLIYHEDPVFIMEDMAPLNYRTVSRENRFNMETAKLVLAKLAKYHAASMVYNKNNGGCLEQLKGTLFEVENGFLIVLLKKFDTLVSDMTSWGDEFAPIIPKMQFIRDNYYAIGRRQVVPSEGLGVFSHGDAWLNNILIRFEEDKLVDVLLIDLQLSCWTSPACDLLYFIFTSLNEVDYQGRFDELIKHYHDNLSSILRKVNFAPVPSLMQLHLEIQSKIVHGKSDKNVD